MSNNPFDTLGMYDDDLAGLFSSLKKAVKKVHKAVTAPVKKLHSAVGKAVAKVAPKSMRSAIEQAHSPNPLKAVMGVHNVGKTATHALEKKLMPSKIRDAKARIQNDPRVKGIATAVAGAFVTPAIAGELVGRSVVTPKRVPKKAKDKIDKDLNSIKSSPEFQEILNSLRDAGASNNQIISTWTGSENFQNVATMNSANAIYQQLYDEYIAAGAAPEIAHKLAMEQALQIGGQATAEIAAKTSNNIAPLLMLGVPIAFALFGG